ncbi:flagellar motor protein MotD [Wenzhouxiangella sp. AB-CW3]|uniref:flagellar motor protein MotD n=1 Tax=Wenzhouxiangella sp. AB-CW3 TaxID=2771012 RepID=UPI00168ACD6A|nr:flagellar motor protein MotD [Wenzhouxiangella sp. AB-CW3]QOC21183.1 flagellar motor protein MotD [Wenzhouxiangella sp. AB-CW3]
MARKKRQEEHANHEAWAIPYGDLITLLLAFFVVMYAVSSVNEGKYRVLAESLTAAFRGPPRSVEPIQVGDPSPPAIDQGRLDITPRSLPDPRVQTEMPRERMPGREALEDAGLIPDTGDDLDVRARELEAGLQIMADEVREALGELIELEQVRVRETPFWLEVEVMTDILFPTGVADISEAARPILRQLAEILAPFPNAIRVEGHTDDVPIATQRFPSNWELSASRATSVVRLFQRHGIEPNRLAALGLGEYRPVADNETVEGRNRNRRVVVIILASDAVPEEFAGRGTEAEAESEAADHEEVAP